MSNSTYLGYEVLDLDLSPDGSDRTMTVSRAIETVEALAGPVVTTSPEVAPSPTFQVTLKALSPYAVGDLLSFLDRRLGRSVGFWVPTFHDDLVLLLSASQGDNQLDFVDIDFHGNAYLANTHVRRHIWVHRPSKGSAYHALTYVTRTAGVTEIYGISPVASWAYTTGLDRFGILRFCRMENDLVDLDVKSNGVVSCTFGVRELLWEP